MSNIVAMENRVCKIRPLYYQCRSCMDIDMEMEAVSDCSKCTYNTTDYELIGVGSGFLGGYALVQNDGKIEKVSLGRVYDIRPKEKKGEG